MIPASSHRLEGLEPDNLLGFVALLGLLRALEAQDRERPAGDQLCPRVAWDIDRPPMRPRLFMALELDRDGVAERAALGLDALARNHDFGGRPDLNYSRRECRDLFEAEARATSLTTRQRIDLMAALMSDAAIKDDKSETVDPTPLCLLFGQGHQHFLERLATVPKQASPPAGKGVEPLTAARCLHDALFRAWHRADPTPSFRWDPEEDVRYALMGGDPTDPLYKTGTQHGANRLAAIGLSALTLVPETRAGRVRPAIIGGKVGQDGFAFAWPIWRDPATLTAIRALLAHPDLHEPGALAHLGVDHVMVARRISVGKFMNFARARAVG
jgi:hypothetical protein